MTWGFVLLDSLRKRSGGGLGTPNNWTRTSCVAELHHPPKGGSVTLAVAFEEAHAHRRSEPGVEVGPGARSHRTFGQRPATWAWSIRRYLSRPWRIVITRSWVTLSPWARSTAMRACPVDHPVELLGVGVDRVDGVDPPGSSSWSMESLPIVDE